MQAEEALELADELIYAKQGKHLNDLERDVFIGSWQGKTYEEIYPLNPQYVEKYVGYKLWKKLTEALGEKVTKKKVQGALERAKKRRQKTTPIPFAWQGLARTENSPFVRVAISDRAQDSELSLAEELKRAIAAAGHQVFLATGQPNDLFLSHANIALQQCDYFVLILSPAAAASEMTIEELRQAKERRDSSTDRKPIVLPIRANCPPDLVLNHDLRNYLQGIRQGVWKAVVDTPKLVREVLHVLAVGGSWETGQEEEWERAVSSTALPKSAPSIPNPSPVADPELPKGQVRLSSAFYVERVPYEEQCYQAIAQPGALIRLKAPRQMGKTSLMARILNQARERGYRTVPLSFQHADKSVFTSLNELLRWFCIRIARKLRLSDRIDDYWTDTYGSKDNCTIFFEDCLLMRTDTPLVLGLDEVDRVFDYPNIADDFFGLLRAWYEDAGRGDEDSELWEKLRLVVVHSTEVYIPMDINQSPFNVGLPIELSEFSVEQVGDLAKRHGLNWSRDRVEQLMKIVGGHPYLVRLALYHISQQQLTLDELLEIAPTEAGIYGDHLRRHLWILQQHPELAQAFRQVAISQQPVELESVLAFKLHSMGLVNLQGNRVAPRFELYRNYFRDRATSWQ